MKIISPGSVPAWDEFSANITCGATKPTGSVGCGAQLSIDAPDLRPFHCFGTHFRHDYVGIACPLCTHINSVEVPIPVRTEVLKLKSTFDGCDGSL